MKTSLLLLLGLLCATARADFAYAEATIDGLQQQMQAESTRYTALSNALKARYDTAKNSINNIR